MTTRRKTVLIAAALPVALAAWYFLSGHQAPQGQAPLAELSARSLEAFKAEFNRASDRVRIVLLLSPT